MITYELIIETLSPFVNTFSCQPNIILNSCNFSHFSEILDNSFYRYGINTSSDNINTTLYDSINYCIESTISNNSNYDLWKISNDIHINIIIFDFKNNTISAVHIGEFFNPWRPTILLANYDKFWEPIVTKEHKIFSFATSKSNILKNNILSQEIKKYNMLDNITICDNFLEIMKNENFITITNTIITDEEDEPISDTFITNNTFSRAKLEKMKKDELMIILTNMNLSINIVKPTKKDIIKIICKD